MAESLFDRYGGFSTVSRIVSDFYGRVRESDTLMPYFSHVEMHTLIDHQTKFIATLMGGPTSYTNEHLRRVHSHLDITSGAFDEGCMLLRETLEDHDVDETDIGTIVAAFRGHRDQVVVERVT